MHPSTPEPHPAADLGTLYRAYRAHVLAQARAATGPDLAEDIASEVWAELAASPRPLDDPGHLHAYLAVLVRHAAADHYRRASAHEMPTADDAPAWHRATAPSAEDTALAGPAREEPGMPVGWRDAMEAALTGRQRSALLLHCEGLSQRAIAAREGYAPATASFHVRRAVVYLRAALTASGAGVAA
ncbi:sigma-70 family RNA polymerase sigma factor [Streptacidiphilus sp. ASG 303]|uniref:RNA polymerase sigma factor n=1 Tax=Streptacidiphilus sp. ASG 303 TaxID=2896847 RepID=UPI001E377553|nr:sigma-70 family RNA polymerase sigma factor [Streptacidiphilus sp. ASG 303]MCD0482044.1 sigma-70 family RNA polymerase sigma factor [Streptacidiphilus sp. ASG 303]